MTSHSNRRELHCAGCGGKVQARLTDGREIYPHRSDLADLPFWKCDTCENYVGCHHKTNNPTQPKGCIPTPQLRAARQRIHKMLDPIWEDGHAKRKEIYQFLSDNLGWKYHTGNVRDMVEVEQVFDLLRIFKQMKGLA